MSDTAPITSPSYHVVTIWHNVQVRDGHPVGFSGYERDHAVTPVFVYVAEHSPDTPERAFRMFNAHEEYLTEGELVITRRYRANRLRSLSVGDIVQAGQHFFSCETSGFQQLKGIVTLNVQANPYEAASWAGSAEAELPRARFGYASAVYNAVLERTGADVQAMRAYEDALKG